MAPAGKPKNPARGLTLRPAREGDLARLGAIAYRTGFFGASAARFFPDERLFADLWVRPYLEGPGGCNLVAILGGETVGYILGAPDSRAYRRYMRGPLLRHLLRRSLARAYPQWRASLPFLLRTLRYGGRHAPHERYPAHLHLNVLAGARGEGVGERLLSAHLDCLWQKGLPGVQLSTTEENKAAIGLYQKLGFKVLRCYPSSLWQPWLGRGAVHVVMGRSEPAGRTGG